MLIIPIPWSRSDLEILREENDLFDLIMKESTQQSYIIIQDNIITWAGQGMVPSKTAYQIKSRTIEAGDLANNPILRGNVGIGGNFASMEDFISKQYPFNGYCIDNMKFTDYRGQKIKGNKDHFSVIEPILCLLSESPSDRLQQFLKVLGWGGRIKVEVLGNWNVGFRLFIGNEEYKTIESWLIQFYKIALHYQGSSESSPKNTGKENENLSFKDVLISVIGIVFVILILKSCFGG